MKLPIQKKILREDLKDAPDWVNGLIGPINNFMETIYQMSNKNIDETNLLSMVKETEYVVPEFAGFNGSIAGAPTAVKISCLNKVFYPGFGIQLAFDGATSINTAISDWNTANPDYPMVLDSGNGAQTPSNGSKAVFTQLPVIKFQSALKVRATGCIILQVYEKITFIPVTSSNPAWTDNNGTITVNGVTGLEPKKTYIIRFRVT